MHASYRVGCVVLAAGCAAADTPGAVSGSHPDPRFVDQSMEARPLHLDAAGVWLPLRLDTSVVGAVGSLNGPEQTTFGRLAGVALTPDSAVVVVDAAANEVRLFSPRGRLIERFGRSGDGPGEFRTPVAIAVSDAGDLAVADLRRRLQVFRRTPNGYKHTSTHALPAGVRSMCYLHDDLIMNARSMEDAFTLRVIDRDGNMSNSFGILYQSPNPLANYELSDGLVACDPERGLIFFGPRSVLGELRAYRRDGTLIWRVSIANYLANKLTDSEGGWTISGSDDGIHVLSSLAFVPGVGLMAQYGHLLPDDLKERRGPQRVYTVLLHPETGRWAIGDASWPVLGAIGHGLAIAVAEDPWPKFESRRIVTEPPSAVTQWWASLPPGR